LGDATRDDSNNEDKSVRSADEIGRLDVAIADPSELVLSSWRRHGFGFARSKQCCEKAATVLEAVIGRDSLPRTRSWYNTGVRVVVKNNEVVVMTAFASCTQGCARWRRTRIW
jgi:hypothetical protein